MPIRWVLVVDPTGKSRPEAFFSTDRRLTPQQIVEYYVLRWNIGVSGEGHITQSVEVRPRPKDSGLVAWEAPWRESKTVEPSDPVHLGCTATH